MVAHTCSPSAWRQRQGGPEVQENSLPHIKSEATVGCIRPYSKNQKDLSNNQKDVAKVSLNPNALKQNVPGKTSQGTLACLLAADRVR